ncbi:hypothetical protein BCV70DRAFT_204966 [Testicularia cyperi]|uniref:Uncharacterized protein n=1 Tax=Testicularia cyperi TaxID=1882483 RepID=A0A317XVF2_9BASI|nr:hypothetical protein BCV70DRAFT_204966 [Testicularia cyperi]
MCESDRYVGIVLLLFASSSLGQLPHGPSQLCLHHDQVSSNSSSHNGLFSAAASMTQQSEHSAPFGPDYEMHDITYTTVVMASRCSGRTKVVGEESGRDMDISGCHRWLKSEPTRPGALIAGEAQPVLVRSGNVTEPIRCASKVLPYFVLTVRWVACRLYGVRWYSRKPSLMA